MTSSEIHCAVFCGQRSAEEKLSSGLRRPYMMLMNIFMQLAPDTHRQRRQLQARFIDARVAECVHFVAA
jgi:hypothetical protein